MLSKFVRPRLARAYSVLPKAQRTLNRFAHDQVRMANLTDTEPREMTQARLRAWVTVYYCIEFVVRVRA